MTFDDENGLPPGLLGEMMGDVVRNNKEKGWYDESRTWGDEIALLHSEISEALEAYRDHGLADSTASLCAICHGDNREHQCKPQGVGAEFADVLIRLLDTCARYDVALAPNEGAARQDLETFGAALTYLHFRAAQFGMHVENRPRYANEFYRVLTDICATYGIDLQAEYVRKMAYNLTRPYRHGGRAL